ncbi:hypothetical protein GO730_09065 [Spirosoma sp. HMF3257]|uniref:hypothetical protein n=1 Tax=Spirosoma telluris TaxID=2183553 RepID=UPI0011B94081|nr:hypothetical protein [Spirosoma telluris]
MTESTGQITNKWYGSALPHSSESKSVYIETDDFRENEEEHRERGTLPFLPRFDALTVALLHIQFTCAPSRLSDTLVGVQRPLPLFVLFENFRL